jgi:fructokinase
VTGNSTPVIAVGDGILDIVTSEDGTTSSHAGGAALNIAVGMARLGLRSMLLATVGHDRAGYWLRGYLREHDVAVLETPTVESTGVASSTRCNGEPRYSFSTSMFRRRINFTPIARDAIRRSAAVVVNSFPLDNPAQVSALLESFRGASGLRVIDPNPRLALILDRQRFREGFEAFVPHASLVKISDEDATILYAESADAVAQRALSLGAKAILVTRGGAGASYLGADGTTLHVPIAQLPSPVIDTLGAGDATLASMVSGLLATGSAPSAAQLSDHLHYAMLVAAATCRVRGGLLQIPR